MDPVTHGLVGSLIAKTARGSRSRFWILTFLGEAPDLDVLAAPLGPWAFWIQHRGISHSLLGLVVIALFSAWAFKRWDPGAYWHRAALYSLPLLFHGFCDYLTSFGVPVLSPFSFRDYSADLVPAVTIIPVIFMVWGLSRMHRQQRQGWNATRPLWMAWIVYLACAFGSKAYAGHLMKPYENGVDRVTIVSGLANPVGWTAVEQSAACCRYRASRINVLMRSVRPGLTLESGTDDIAVLGSMASPLVQNFIAMNRWPVARTTPTSSGWDVDWGKVIFSSRGVVRGQVRVKVGLDGKMIQEAHLFDFWDPKEHQVPVGPVETVQ